jgi:hypothetical protein
MFMILLILAAVLLYLGEFSTGTDTFTTGYRSAIVSIPSGGYLIPIAFVAIAFFMFRRR